MPSLEAIGKNAENKREEFKKNAANKNKGRELFFPGDGDLANIAIVPSGSPEEAATETRLLDYHQHSERVQPTGPQDSGWRFSFCTLAVTGTCEACDRGVYKQYRFAFWAYVYNRRIKNQPQNTDNWQQVKAPSGMMWQQEINDFRIVSLPFGKSDMYWQLLLQLSYDKGGLNTTAVRVSRTGLMKDTVWGLTAIDKPKVDWSEIGEGADELQGLNDYFMEREAAKKAIVEDSVSLEDEDETPFEADNTEAPEFDF